MLIKATSCDHHTSESKMCVSKQAFYDTKKEYLVKGSHLLRVWNANIKEVFSDSNNIKSNDMNQKI